MKKPLIIFGNTSFAQIACEYFTEDSEHEVVGFSVEDKYIEERELFSRPVVSYREVSKHFAPEKHSFFAACTYTQMNALRARFYSEAKAMGYTAASYVSSKAFVWKNVEIGEHCFIFEDNTIQPFVKIAANNIFWSGNHIGHHSHIGNNNFFSSHVVISGHCEIGDNSFFGVNSTVSNNLSVGNNCLLAAGSLVIANVPDNEKAIGIWKRKP